MTEKEAATLLDVHLHARPFPSLKIISGPNFGINVAAVPRQRWSGAKGRGDCCLLMGGH